MAAAASLREGSQPRTRRFFAATNCIEHLIGIVRYVPRDNSALGGPGLERAAARFPRIKGHHELGTLATALPKGDASAAAM